jgi:hypothetical protein
LDVRTLGPVTLPPGPASAAKRLDMMPQIVQQLMRLKDIRRRIEAGASVEAIGEEIQRIGAEKGTPP